MAASQKRRLSSDSEDSDFLPKVPLAVDYSRKGLLVPSNPLDKFDNMLLSSVIGLNRTFGKIVVTGLSLDKSGVFSPVVFLCGNNFNGVSLSNEAWKNFIKEFPAFSHFFGAVSRRSVPAARVHCEGFSYRFLTACYGKRTIAIYPGPSKNDQPTNSGGTSTSRIQPPLSEPALYLQEITFKKLVDVVNVINLHLKNLQANISVAHECKSQIVNVLKGHIPSITKLMGKNAERADSGRFILGNIMKQKNDSGESVMCDIVRSKIQIDNFACNVDLIISEITDLYHDAIVDEAIGH